MLLLDEPLSALDFKLRKDMQIELKRLQHETGITFIFVTHDQEEALTMSDRIAVMSQGKILQVGTPRDIYDQPGRALRRRFHRRDQFPQGRVVAKRATARAHGAGCRRAPMLGRRLPRGASSPDGKVTVVVRPEHADLGREPGDRHGRRNAREHRLFRHRHALSMSGSPSGARLHRAPARTARRRRGLRAGDTVGIAVSATTPRRC